MTEPSDRELQELLDAERRAGAAARRRQQGWLTRRAAEEATLGSVLLNLAERRATVLVHVVGGASCRGRAAAVGADHLTVDTVHGRALVALASITTVAPEPGVPTASGRDDPQHHGIGLLVDALRLVADERCRVRLHLADGTTVDGIVAACGADVVTITTPPGSPVHVRAGAVAMVLPRPTRHSSVSPPLSPWPTTSG